MFTLSHWVQQLSSKQPEYQLEGNSEKKNSINTANMSELYVSTLMGLRLNETIKLIY